MAKQLKMRYEVTAIITDTVPEGGKPLKLKDIKAMLPDTLLADDGAEGRLTDSKIKVAAVE